MSAAWREFSSSRHNKEKKCAPKKKVDVMRGTLFPVEAIWPLQEAEQMIEYGGPYDSTPQEKEVDMSFLEPFLTQISSLEEVNDLSFLDPVSSKVLLKEENDQEEMPFLGTDITFITTVKKLASNRENRTDRGSGRMNQDSPRDPVQSVSTEEVIQQTVIDTISGIAKNISDACGEFLFENQAVTKAIFPSHYSAAETNMIKSETLNVETKLEENEILAKEAKSKSRLFGRFCRRKKN